MKLHLHAVVKAAGTGMPRSARRQPSGAGLQPRFVRPRRVCAGDGAGQGGDVGTEREGVGDVLESQPVNSAAEVPESGEAVQQARGEGVPGADGVHDVHGRGRDGAAMTIEGGQGATPSEVGNGEARASGVPGAARLFGAGRLLALRWFPYRLRVSCQCP